MRTGPRAIKKEATIYCWTEPVDDNTVAMHARCRVAHHRGVWGLSVFVLVPIAEARRWNSSANMRDGHALVRERLRSTLAEQHNGHLPYICRIDQADRLGLT